MQILNIEMKNTFLLHIGTVIVMHCGKRELTRHVLIFDYRFYKNKFYPVDYLGYGDEGQTDCEGIPSNLAFTSAIRSGKWGLWNSGIAQ